MRDMAGADAEAGRDAVRMRRLQLSGSEVERNPEREHAALVEHRVEELTWRFGRGRRPRADGPDLPPRLAGARGVNASANAVRARRVTSHQPGTSAGSIV